MDSIRTEITEQTFENFDKKFKVILADPPWSYQNGGRGSAAGEYPCMSLDDICNLKVIRIGSMFVHYVKCWIIYLRNISKGLKILFLRRIIKNLLIYKRIVNIIMYKMKKGNWFLFMEQ